MYTAIHKKQMLEKRQTLVEYLIVFFIIMSTDTVSLPIENRNIINFCIGIASCIGILCYLLKTHWVINKNVFIFIGISCICCMLAKIINHDDSLAYELKISLILLGFLIVKKVRFEKFKKVYVNIMCFIAIISILVFVTVKADMTWWSILPMTNHREHYSLLFSVVPVNMAHRQRLFGPFWEPGVYQCYLNIAILFIILDKMDMKKVVRAVILASAVLMTFSTTGYICLFLIFGVFISKRIGYISKRKLIIGIAAVLAIFFILQNDYIQWVVFEKFQRTSVGNSSFIFRLKDIKFYFYEGMKNPLFGNGIMPSFRNVVHQYRAFGYEYSGTTSTTMREFAGLGGIFAALKLVLQYKFSKKIAPNRLCGFLIFFIFLIMLNTEDFIYSLFFNTIFFYGLGSVAKGRNA